MDTCLSACDFSLTKKGVLSTYADQLLARADTAVFSSRYTVVILNLHSELTTFNFQASVCGNQPDNKS